MKETVIKTVQTPVLGEMDEATIQKNRENFFSKMAGKKPAETQYYYRDDSTMYFMAAWWPQISPAPPK